MSLSRRRRRPEHNIRGERDGNAELVDQESLRYGEQFSGGRKNTRILQPSYGKTMETSRKADRGNLAEHRYSLSRLILANLKVQLVPSHMAEHR